MSRSPGSLVACPETNILIAADYSQVEMRVLAQVSQDMDLQAVFRGQGDVYRELAARPGFQKGYEVPPNGQTIPQL